MKKIYAPDYIRNQKILTIEEKIDYIYENHPLKDKIGIPKETAKSLVNEGNEASADYYHLMEIWYKEIIDIENERSS